MFRGAAEAIEFNLPINELSSRQSLAIQLSETCVLGLEFSLDA
jgi:hypothetical protein